MKNKMGFTLVELLIIVLIIGILAAVALPYYETAVDESRYAGLMPMGKNLAEAQEIYHASNGSYSNDFSKLDVIPGNPEGNSVSLSDGMTVFLSDINGYNYVKVGTEKLDNYHLVYLQHSKNYAKEIHCEALATSTRANRLCSVLGGELIPGNTTAGYNTYVLEGEGDGTPYEVPTLGACTVRQNDDSCTRYAYLDGSSYETYTTASNGGTDVRRDYDANGVLTRVWNKSSAYEQTTDYEDGIRTHVFKEYSDGMTAEAWFYANGNVEHEIFVQAGETITVYITEEGKGKEIVAEYAAGDITRSYFNEDGTVSYTTTSWYNEDNDKIRYYNDYSDPNNAIQTQYYEDGSIRGYWTNMTYSFEVSGGGGFSYSWGGDSEGTYYNRDGSLSYSESNEASGSVRYDYNSDGTYIRKPDNTSDTSQWTYGTYTATGTNGDILRDDGVTVPGRGNYPTLCESHPTMPQCSSN